jgi:hypothetical protein
MIETKIDLSEYQIKKIGDALLKNHIPVRIRLSYKQIAGKGGYEIRIYNAQKQKLDESKKLKKGLVLELNHERIKTGGFLPALIAAIPSIIEILGGLGAAAGGVTAIVNSVKTAKHQSAEEEEMKRHNLEMEKIAKTKQALSLTGSGLKTKKMLSFAGSGFKTKTQSTSSKTKTTGPKPRPSAALSKTNSTGSKIKIKVKKIEPLSNFDSLKQVKDLKIKHFRGVFMKDELPQKNKKTACGIINLEDSDKIGSHWVAYYTNNDKKYYFDSY